MVSDPIPRLNAALAGRYTVERELGQGGMATVYLAQDLRHERRVALKVLKPNLAAALGGERFLAEIKTTANLQHPHILPLHDSGEADELLFYTMPYVEGETLRQRIEREGRLPIEDAVHLATDVAEALQAAHEQGVIHRDIKPSNILLSRGKALVADFGIAWVGAQAEGTRLTQTGSSLGTAGYMSPEQASGDTEIDGRSDTYSLGCVLFEMLTGEPPYGGQTFMSVFAKQATQPVPSVRGLRPDIPVNLERAVTTVLAKEPSHRFQSAAAFASALSLRAATTRAASATKTVVVLPFVNRSPDPDNEYFADGLTDEVITDLAGVSALRVIARNSAMALKGTTKNNQTLARELGVTHLVTGTVRRAGTALRVTADLVEASTDVPIWTEKFSGTIEDVFGIQEEISRKIVAALKVKFTDTEEREVAARPIEDPVAYDCYLRAYQMMYTWTPLAQRRALMLVDEALGIVPRSALLLAMKGQLYWTLVNINLSPIEETLALAEGFVTQALALDPESHLAIFVRGLIEGVRGQSLAALTDLYRARELRPGDANVFAPLCRFSNSSGLRNHLKHAEHFVRIDPLTPQAHLTLAAYHQFCGSPADAAEPARRSIELAPDNSILHVFAAWAIAAAGFREEAVEIFDRAGQSIREGVTGPLATFLKYAFEGDAEGALRVATPDMERSITNDMAGLAMAEGYALVGRTEDAMRRLRIAVQYGFINYPYLSTTSDFLASVRDEPEFQALMAEVKPRWEAVLEWEQGLEPR